MTPEHKTQITIAVIGLLGVVLTAMFSNWDKLFPQLPDKETEILVSSSEVESVAMNGTDQNLCVSQRSEVCGIESYIVKQSAFCGYDLNTGTGAACGANKYNSGKSSACGVGPATEEIYLWPQRVATGGVIGNGNGRGHTCRALNLNDANVKCRSKGYDIATGRYGEPSVGKPCNDEFVSCANFNTCEHESFGILSFKSCKDPSFGKTEKVCPHEEHGVAQYKKCEIDINTGERC